MLTLYYLELVSKKNYLFCVYWEWWHNQSALGLNRDLLSYVRLRSVNHVKFTEECIICMEKHVLVKTFLQMAYTCHTESELKGQSMKKKHTVSLETKWPRQAFSVLGYERIHHNLFYRKKFNGNHCFLLTTYLQKIYHLIIDSLILSLMCTHLF